MFNLGQLVWQRMETACAEIRDLGLEVAGQGFEIVPETPDALRTALENEWPKNTLRSDLDEPRAGLFLDPNCKGPEAPCYEIIVRGPQLETGAGDFGARAVSFSLNEVPCKPQRELAEEPGEEPVEGLNIDPLTEIRGIGPDRAGKLGQKGIRTFAQFASTSPDLIQELIPGVKREEIETWLEQARKLSTE
jgi:predicted flap endonuclease-1-like 5' DNA nuclease